MWKFEGAYTGEAAKRIQRKKKKQAIGWGIYLSVFFASIYTVLAFVLGEGNATYITIIVCGGLLTMAAVVLVFFLDYYRAPKCGVKIANDGIEIFQDGRWGSFAFYKIQSIEYGDDFIELFPCAILQKDLLIEGDWEELKTLLKRIEESLGTDEPIYQIEEPITEFLEVTVQSKRIFKKFVGEVQRRVGVLEYFATFALSNGETIECSIGQETFERIQEGQTGTLVLVGGKFFAFGEGETIE